MDERRIPLAPLVFTVLALASALALVDWTGSGRPRGLLLAVPALLGLAGALTAHFDQRLRPGVRTRWTLLPLLAGLLVVPALVVAVTLTQGP